jgi:hypothetical protein
MHMLSDSYVFGGGAYGHPIFYDRFILCDPPAYKIVAEFDRSLELHERAVDLLPVTGKDLPADDKNIVIRMQLN